MSPIGTNVKKYFTVKLRKIQNRDLDLNKTEGLGLKNPKRRKRSTNTKTGDAAVVSPDL